jgi:hypothetical protein
MAKICRAFFCLTYLLQHCSEREPWSKETNKGVSRIHPLVIHASLPTRHIPRVLIHTSCQYLTPLGSVILPTIDHSSITTMQRHNTENSKQIVPEKELSATVPIPTFMFLWAIYIFPLIGLPILLQENRWTERGYIYCIDRSQTHECGNWDWGRRNLFSGNTYIQISLQWSWLINTEKIRGALIAKYCTPWKKEL